MLRIQRGTTFLAIFSLIGLTLSAGERRQMKRVHRNVAPVTLPTLAAPVAPPASSPIDTAKPAAAPPQIPVKESSLASGKTWLESNLVLQQDCGPEVPCSHKALTDEFVPQRVHPHAPIEHYLLAPLVVTTDGGMRISLERGLSPEEVSRRLKSRLAFPAPEELRSQPESKVDSEFAELYGGAVLMNFRYNARRGGRQMAQMASPMPSSRTRTEATIQRIQNEMATTDWVAEYDRFGGVNDRRNPPVSQIVRSELFPDHAFYLWYRQSESSTPDGNHKPDLLLTHARIVYAPVLRFDLWRNGYIGHNGLDLLETPQLEPASARTEAFQSGGVSFVR